MGRVVSPWFWSAQAEHPCPEKEELSVPHVLPELNSDSHTAELKGTSALSILWEAGKALEVRSNLTVMPSTQVQIGPGQVGTWTNSFCRRLSRTQSGSTPTVPSLQTIEEAPTDPNQLAHRCTAPQGLPILSASALGQFQCKSQVQRAPGDMAASCSCRGDSAVLV